MTPRYPLAPGVPDLNSRVSRALWWGIGRARELFWLLIPIALAASGVTFLWTLAQGGSLPVLALQGGGVGALSALALRRAVGIAADRTATAGASSDTIDLGPAGEGGNGK